jgi:hypothetical protein
MVMVGATIIALIGFWKLSPVATFAVAFGALIVAIISFWVTGKDD